MTKPKQPYRKNCKKIWEDANGKVPEHHEIHHKVPRRFGGEDVLENLEVVTKEQHKQRHLDLYQQYGDFRDLCAYHMIGFNFTEAHKIASSNGGKIGGQKVYDSGVGIFRSDDDRKQWASMGGKVGGVVQRDNKLGIHAQTREERLACASAGGKKGCLVNGWKDPAQQSARGKKGGVKNKGSLWYNDGVNMRKYTANMQLEKPFEQFLEENPQFNAGYGSIKRKRTDK